MPTASSVGTNAAREFIDGAIVAMAGARPPHNMIAANVTAALVVLTRGRGCVTMTSDQRVHVPATHLYAYPDVSVTYGKRRYSDDDPPSLLNPTVLVEVTSDSTEDFDRGTKFIHYQPSPNSASTSSCPIARFVSTTFGGRVTGSGT